MDAPKTVFPVCEGNVSYRLLLPNSDEDYIQERIRNTGAPYEVRMLRDMAARLSQNDTVIDVGANIGNHTIYLARLVGCRVLAFEPNAHLAHAIKDSAEMNGLSKLVEVRDVGVGNRSGTAKFRQELRTNLGGQALELGSGDIQVITLDEMNYNRSIRAIKIDVEGFELQVLQGAQALIARDRPIIYVECADEQQFVAVFDWMSGSDYVLCEQFNATPTHLFVPSEQITLAAYSRDVVRQKTIDLFRSQCALQTTKRDFHAASDKARNLGLQVDNLKSQVKQIEKSLDEESVARTQLQSRVTSLALEKSQITLRAARLEREIASLRNSYKAVREKLIATQRSRAYRTGVALREGLTSPRGFVALPIRLFRIMRSTASSSTAASSNSIVNQRTSRPVAKATVPPLSNSHLSELSAARDFIVISAAYPSSSRNYGGEFVRTRVEGYLKTGLTGMVVEINQRNVAAVIDYGGSLPVLRAHPAHLSDLIDTLKSGQTAVLCHSPSPDMQTALLRVLPGRRLIFWFHGFELRDYRRLFFNFDTAERERRRASLDMINQQRWEAARETFTAPGVVTVFVSDFLKQIAARDVGCPPENGRIIPNFIDGEFYHQHRRDPLAARRILMIRPFKSRNYGYDIAIEAIRILSSRDGFSDLFFTIRGFGENFSDATAVLSGLTNVTLEERYSTPEEMRALYAEHGIALCPTRHDTQGVSLGEAMASGMACVTHDVAAIPEFTDKNCAVLVRPNDPVAYAEAIWALAHDPARVGQLAEAAAKRVRAQCGADQTIRREEQLIRTAAGMSA